MENNEILLFKEKAVKQNRVWVRISNVCNNNCIFCLDSYSHNGTFVEEKLIKKQIKDGFKSGYENRVIISGGEASINPFFSEYIGYAKEIGYDRVQTITNGVMFGNQEFVKKVIDAGLEEITFSFHGHNETLHDYLVATPGAFKKSLSGLIHIKKNFPKIIINIDIVVNKINVVFLPDIIKFFLKLGVYEFDILQIIPFGRAFFPQNKKRLFYNIKENIAYLRETWKLSRISGMYMWTNRFPAEAFEGYEDLIQDPKKIKSEVMGEGREVFDIFISSKGKQKPQCFGDTCEYCFQKDYCHNFLKYKGIKNIKDKKSDNRLVFIKSKNFVSDIYKEFGENKENFITFLKQEKEKGNILINIPKCLFGSGMYQTYDDMDGNYTLEDYTEKYITNLYRKKSLSCKDCKYNNECEGIHINFIRAYGFSILKAIK
ncbi:radical SAM protein [Candidatus Gracilibacteria bacterium]|nr:radical SAM protein [Candidatus Gracilibacteria bacterium]NUJ98869.1 radical SAM protein [Candidatus Gracilibacteria bacterium]